MASPTNTDNTGSTNKKKKKPIWREWVDAAVFAIVAATLIRTFLFEAYTIPSGSMENTMLVNDFLFVSKLSYGPRIPMTPLAVPLVHNTMPFTGGKSYIDGVQWKYHRLPGFGHVQRYDVVVFNYPAGDTIMTDRPLDDYYGTLRNEYNNDPEALKARHQLMVRPVDKKENYIKRCVAVAGDTLEVKDGVVFINGKQAPLFAHSKRYYILTVKGGSLKDFAEDNNIEVINSEPGAYRLNLENDQVALVKNQPFAASLVPDTYAKGTIPRIDISTENGEAIVPDIVFPADTTNFKWNRDNYGPIVIPKEGVTVNIDLQNIALYRRVISNYEGNKLEEHNGKIFINGKAATSYTFKMDYYWMMGDNRDNSLDSRYWGYVPVDHVVGKAWLVWFSYSELGMTHGIRWKRLMHTVHSLER